MREQLTYIYHFFPEADEQTIRQYGLLSPRALYTMNRGLFHRKTFRTYLERAARFLRKPPQFVTDDDILLYLDTAPHRKRLITSTSLFFSLLPLDAYDVMYVSALKKVYGSEPKQCTVDIKYLQEFSPMLIQDRHVTRKTWDVVLKPEFLEEVKKLAHKVPTGNFIFSDVPHIAVGCTRILPQNINFGDPPSDKIMFFPDDARQQIILGKKTQTTKISDQVGKYQQGEIYRCASYSGTLWNIWIKTLSVEHMRIKYARPEVKKDKKLQADLRKYGVSISDYCDVIKFKVVKK